MAPSRQDKHKHVPNTSPYIKGSRAKRTQRQLRSTPKLNPAVVVADRAPLHSTRHPTRARRWDRKIPPNHISLSYNPYIEYLKEISRKKHVRTPLDIKRQKRSKTKLIAGSLTSLKPQKKTVRKASTSGVRAAHEVSSPTCPPRPAAIGSEKESLSIAGGQGEPSCHDVALHDLLDEVNAYVKYLAEEKNDGRLGMDFISYRTSAALRPAAEIPRRSTSPVASSSVVPPQGHGHHRRVSGLHPAEIDGAIVPPSPLLYPHVPLSALEESHLESARWRSLPSAKVDQYSDGSVGGSQLYTATDPTYPTSSTSSSLPELYTDQPLHLQVPVGVATSLQDYHEQQLSQASMDTNEDMYDYGATHTGATQDMECLEIHERRTDFERYNFWLVRNGFPPIPHFLPGFYDTSY